MQHILAILHSDQEYADSLMDYMNLHPVFLFKVIAFTDYTILMSYLRQHKIQTLLFDDSIEEEEVKQTKIKSCYYLSEVVSESNFGEYKTIFMYQSAEKIMEKVLHYYEEDGNRIFLGKGKLGTEMIIVSGVTSLSQQYQYSRLLAEKLVSDDNRTLLISFQPFIEHKSTEETYPMSELLYIFRMEEGYIEKLPQWIVHEKEYDQLSGVEHFSDLSEFTGEEYLQFIDGIMKQEMYTHIILDIPAVSTAVSLLSAADKIYLLAHEKEEERQMMTQMKEHLKKKEGEHIVERITEVTI